VIFQPTRIEGVWTLEPERRADARGFFARTWCAAEMAERGLDARLSQASISFNARAGTLRGLHYQAAPDGEAKVVRCTAGAIHDVALDLRPGSPTRGHWTAVELSAENRRALYIPEGVAHGFQSLVDGAEVLYLISVPQAPESARGVRWNDPAFGIEWPLPVSEISARDASYPDWTP
jgi:dTDP-4-dehydrorhamnose 3,5-epimerase